MIVRQQNNSCDNSSKPIRKNMEKMSLDEAFMAVGEFGRYQFIYFLFNNLVGFPISYQMLHMVFIGAKPQFSCLADQPIDFIMNASKLLSPEDLLPISPIGGTENEHASSVAGCNLNHGEKCSKYVYFSNFTSVISEWDLVCDHAYMASFGQSIFMAGVLVGAAIFGPITDKYGRKKMYFISLLGAMVASLASSFAPNLTVFLVFRFLAGFNCAGNILAAFVLLMEVVGTEWRPTVSMLGSIFGSFGVAAMSLLAYFIHDWRQLSIVYGLSGFVFLPFYPIIPESPRWLYGRGRITEAENLFLLFARKNGRTHIKEIHLKPLEEVDEQTGSLISLVKSFSLFKVTVIQLFSWFVNCIVYYGLTTGAGELGGSMYVDVFISGLIEIPSTLLVLFLLKFIGRRVCCCAFMIAGGAACMCVVVVPPSNSLAIMVLAMTGKLSISASFQIIYLWSAEIYPTVIRNSSMGLMSMGARVGGIIAPMVDLLGLTSAALPYLVYGALSFAGGVLNFFLPETRRRVLPQTMDDMNRLVKGEPSISDKPGNDYQRVKLLDDNDDNDDNDLSDDNGDVNPRQFGRDSYVVAKETSM